MSRTNSVVVRCHGTARPPKASPTTRSALSSGTSRRSTRASPVTIRSWSRRHKPELVLGQRDHARVELEDEAGGARPRGRQVAGDGEPAAAEVDGVDRLARRRGTVDDVAEQLGVRELEVRRVVEVDVGVAQVVEHEEPSRRAVEVAQDGRGVVRGLDVARVAGRRPRHPTPGPRAGRRRRRPGPAGAGRGGTTAPAPPATRTRPRAMTTGVMANSATKTNPVRKTPTSDPAVPSAESRPTMRPVSASEPSWILTTSGVAALSSADGTKKPAAARHDDGRRIRRGAAGPSARMIGTEAMAAAPPSASAPGGEPRVDAVGQPAAEPRAEGDPGEDDADDRGERLQRHADVRRQQAPGEDLQHQHGPGGGEHDRTGEAAVHRPDRTGVMAPRPGRHRPAAASAGSGARTRKRSAQCCRGWRFLRRGPLCAGLVRQLARVPLCAGCGATSPTPPRSPTSPTCPAAWRRRMAHGSGVCGGGRAQR